MINKDTKVNVVNKFNGTVGYTIPDLRLHRNFYPGESKEISFDELEQLSYTPGGREVLEDYLEVKDKEVISALFSKEPEPEYFYSREDIINLMKIGTLDQFLDCLDFAPESVKEMIKDLAVSLPLNDVAKRQAVLDKLGFDVTKAIEVQNTKFDGGDEAAQSAGKSVRRAAAPVQPTSAATATSARRVTKATIVKSN